MTPSSKNTLYLVSKGSKAFVSCEKEVDTWRGGEKWERAGSCNLTFEETVSRCASREMLSYRDRLLESDGDGN